MCCPIAKAVPIVPSASSSLLVTPSPRSALVKGSRQKPKPSLSLSLMGTVGSQLRFLIKVPYADVPTYVQPSPRSSPTAS